MKELVTQVVQQVKAHIHKDKPRKILEPSWKVYVKSLQDQGLMQVSHTSMEFKIGYQDK